MGTLPTVTATTSRRLRAGILQGALGKAIGEGAVGRQWELPSPWPVPLQLSQQSRCPDFFLFLCRLLSPLLKAFAQAATFLHRGQLPDTGEAHATPAVLRG